MRMLKTIAWLLLGGFMACVDAGCTADDAPGPSDAAPADGDINRDCPELCAVEDTSIAYMPANRCPGADEQACVEECRASMPMGAWCFPP